MPAIVAILLLAFPWALAQQHGDEEWEDAWFEDEAGSVDSVSDGELVFLDALPQGRVHHHQNRVTITPASLEGGWVRLEQCHRDLDPVPDAEVVYGAGRVRGLEVVRAERIGRAAVEGPTVQLKDVGRGAALCIRAETRALHRTEGGYVLQNGPYMRRFLDGYYPMRVTLGVELEVAGLELAAVEPPPQPGLELVDEGRRITLEARFEGRLITRLHFAQRP